MTGDDVAEPTGQDAPDNAYVVGYCKPPKSTQFRKGQSGNPNGRRKSAKSLKALLTVALDEKVTVSENGESRKISKREAAAKQLANRVAMGDLASLRLMVELLSEREEREDQAITANAVSTARERVTAKLAAMAARIRASHGLPPE